MNWKILLPGLLVVALLVLVLASGFGKDPRALPSTMEGRPAPEFELRTLEGETVRLSDLRGRPVVLNFWSTWCRPCVVEHPVLQRYAELYGPGGPVGRDVAFFGVLYGDEPERAQAYLQRVGAAYPTLEDPSQRVVVDYGVGGVPETYFISRDGTIVSKYAGAISAQTLKGTLEAMQ